ncbi:MAG: hypothetical protein ABI895_42985, partial [Deltaproteobacteria bacterium]
MTGQDTQVAQQVHAGCGHCSAQADQEVLGLEQDGSSAVFPDALQPQLQPTIGVLLKYALEHAREQGLVSIFLDSRP